MIKLRGIDSTIRALQAAKVGQVARMITAVDMAALDVQNHAKANHMRGLAHGLGRYENQTMNLTGSITVQPAKLNGSTITAAVTTNVWYAQQIEFGVPGKRRAYPFMGPAYMANRDAINKRFRQLSNVNR